MTPAEARRLEMLGRVCAMARSRSNFTQQQIADKLGVTFGCISAFEHGRSTNLNILLWYAQYLTADEWEIIRKWGGA